MPFNFNKSASKGAKTVLPTTYTKEFEVRDSSSTYSYEPEKAPRNQLSQSEKNLIKGTVHIKWPRMFKTHRTKLTKLSNNRCT